MPCTRKVILYIDDDADDRELLSEAIKMASSEITVDLAENGLKALDYLNTSKENEALPCLIVLDLNMPYVDGFEFFSQIKKDDRFKDLPVIIFSSSERNADKILFGQLGIEYISKPNSITYLNSVASHFVAVCN